MLGVDEIVKLHEATVIEWHTNAISNVYQGPWQIICQQHSFNFELWHQEDMARNPRASDAEIAQVKRNIDRLNQARNDYIEKIDDWITQYLISHKVSLIAGATQRTETPGSAIDRLSIMALRIYHYQEQCTREDTTAEHQQKVVGRLRICLEQRQDLAKSLSILLNDIAQGTVCHKTYRQYKMYNDPALNPYLYELDLKFEI